MYSRETRSPENPRYVAGEIEKLIENNQLDLATKKLMDFATNFGRAPLRGSLRDRLRRIAPEEVKH